MPGDRASTSHGREGVGVCGRATTLYREIFRTPPVVIADAPGRVNLIGEHTDYNDGFVLPMGIGLRTAGAIGPSGDGRWHFVSEHEPTPVRFDGSDVWDQSRRDWTGYCRGVLAGFSAAGYEIEPMCVAVASDVPVGAGLSSSAALEVATATAMEIMLGVRLDPMDKALLCQKAEQEFAGVPCGLMDQVACVLADAGGTGSGRQWALEASRPVEIGGAVLFDCRTLEVRWIAIDPSSVLVIDSGVRHVHSGGAYAVRRLECQRAVAALRKSGFAVDSLRDASPAMLEVIRGDDLLFRRARHVVTENARAIEAAAVLESGGSERFARLGQLMRESHASLRDDFEVSCTELDRLVNISRAKPGVYGARMTGGGFGGCIVALVEPGCLAAIGRAVVQAFADEGFGSATWMTAGATGLDTMSPET